MPANAHRWVWRWRVDGTVNEVADILGEVRSLPEWWGASYREAEVDDEGDATGAGKIFRQRESTSLSTGQ